jgi:hypothetical protein
MGLMSKLFGNNSQSNIEKKLEDFYVPCFQEMMGASLSEAKRMFKDMFEQVKEDSQKKGTINLPDNFGDILIESTSDKDKTYLLKIRKEGVTDQDIRWWWNRHDLERGMICHFDYVNMLTQVKMKMEADRIDMNKAAEWARKHYPFYGDPSDTSRFTGDDRPLPYELGNRINVYVEKRILERDLVKRELEAYSSFNAVIRKEIREGNL